MSDWQVLHLDELADIRVSNVDKKSQRGETPVRLCNYMDVYSNDYITSDLDFMEATASAAECEKFKVEQGDVLITKDSETPDDIGIPSVAVDEIENLVCGYHLALIKPKRNAVDPVYLSKQIASADVASYFSRMAAGSTRYGLSNVAIGRTRIPLPPLFKQQKIGSVLRAVDRAIERTEALIEKYQRIKAGLMHDLFTRGIGADGKLRPPREQAPELYQQTPVGWIPKEWAVRSCAELCTRICVGIVIKPTQYYVEEGVPAFRSANVREDGIDPSNFVYISEVSNTFLAKSQVKEGDILSVRTGYPGTSAIVPTEFRGANCIDILISTPGESVSSEYLCDWINSPFGKEQVLRQQGGMAQQHFNVGEMKQLLVALPDAVEQEFITDRIQACSAKIRAEQEFLAKLVEQKVGLMHDLLTGERPVKLATEPAKAEAHV